MGGTVEFTTRVSAEGLAIDEPDNDGVSDDDLAKSPKLYITDPKDDAVEFKINGAPFARFSAGEELDKIEFSFTAASTSIKDGQVRFKLPSGWTRAVVPDSAEDSGS